MPDLGANETAAEVVTDLTVKLQAAQAEVSHLTNAIYSPRARSWKGSSKN